MGRGYHVIAFQLKPDGVFEMMAFVCLSCCSSGPQETETSCTFLRLKKVIIINNKFYHFQAFPFVTGLD